MAFGSWDQVIEEYKTVYANSRYAEQAEAMLHLIPELVSKDAVRDFVPGTSHASLFLEKLGNNMRVYIWCEKLDELYSVSLAHLEKGELERKTVSYDKIVEVLTGYLRKIG